MSQGFKGRALTRTSLVLSCLLLPPVLVNAQQTSFFDAGASKAFRAATSPADQEYLVDVGARLILPGQNSRIDFSRGAAEVYLQFDGALSAEQRKGYVLAGTRFDAAMRGHTYRARISRQAAGLLRHDPRFRGIEPVLPADKMTVGLFHGQVNPNATMANGYMATYVRFHENVRLDHALRVLDRWQVIIDDPNQFLYQNQMLTYLTTGQVQVLAEERSVRSMHEAAPEPQDDNIDAAILSNVDDIQAAPFNLDGTGVLIGQWESGHALTTHEQLTGRINVVEGGTTDHGTHVAGTILGDGTNNADALGMAPGAGPIFAWTSGGNTANEQFLSWQLQSILLATHSWGWPAGYEGGTDTGDQDRFGRYDTTCSEYDDLVLDTGLIVQKSSGNQGDDCHSSGAPCDGTTGTDGIAYGTITLQGNSKNILTIGAVTDGGALTGFSSCGPTDDDRIKPDLVANGAGLTSAWAQGVTTPLCIGDDYCSINGTSMSTPVVTGGIAALTQLYRQVYFSLDPDPEVIKAVLVNTAQDLGRPGPDYAFGHGLFDALAAAEIIQDGMYHIQTDAVDNGDMVPHLIEVQGTEPTLRVTAAWVDFPGVADSTDPDLVNDLDLVLIAPSGGMVYPFSGPTGDTNDPATNTARNTVDNVEVAVVDNPEQGFWQAMVVGHSVPQGPQGYAITSNLAFLTPNQPEIEISANLVFEEHCPGDTPAEKTVTIYNTGGGTLLVHDLQITGAGTDFSLAPNPAPPFVILSGSHIDVTVLFDPQSPGAKSDNLRIFSNDFDEGEFDLAMTGTGGAPISHATMESNGWFGDVALGDFKVLEIQLLNQGTCNLTVSDLFQALGGPEFSVGAIPGHPAFPIIVFPGEAVAVPLKYEPADYGTDVATFNILSDDTVTPTISINVTGNSDAPIISTSGSLDFPDTCPGDFTELELNICNTGVSDLDVTSVTFGSPCGEFSFVNNPFPATVSHDFCLPVTVRYTPTAFGDQTCSLVIQSNDPNNPTVTLPITGTTPPPIINVTGSLDFGEVCPGELAEQDLDICNTGLCNLEVSSVAFNPPCVDFTIINNPFPAAVSHDFCLAVTIRYTPTSAGFHQCTLEILSNDPANPVVTLPVTGTTPDSVIDVPPDLAFLPTPIQDVAACSTSELFPVTNIGDCPMTVTGFDIVQAGADYSVAQLPTLPATLLPGESLGEGALQLVFAPFAVMRHSTAEVRVTYVTNTPAMGDTETVTRQLCGEATRTGVRILVTELDVPVGNVEHLNFYRVYNPGTSSEALSIITTEHDMGIITILPAPPCEGFVYQREWGALDDERFLEPGTYKIVASIINRFGNFETRQVQFELAYCDFWHDARIDFN